MKIMKLKKMMMVCLPFVAAVLGVSCDLNSGNGGSLSNEKKLTDGRVEYQGGEEDLRRYVVTLRSTSTKAGDNFNNANISLKMVLITADPEQWDQLVSGQYAVSTEAAPGAILIDADSSLSVYTEGSYAGDPAELTSGTITVASFNGKYEIKGEVTDADGRVLEFSFYNGLTFISTADDDEEPAGVTITFEDAELTAESGEYSNILWGKELATDVEGVPTFDGILYTEQGASLGSYYYQSVYGDYVYDVWNGFALSSNISLDDLGMDYSNQFGVYAASASIFAVGYAPVSASTAQYAVPTIEFAEPVMVASVDVANANKTYFYCQNTPMVGEDDAAEPIWVNLVVTGSLNGSEVGTLTVELAKDGNVVADWTTVDFSTLGQVDKLQFVVESNDVDPTWGLNVPSYFCLDNIVLR